MKQFVLALLASALLAGCGFRPLYAGQSGSGFVSSQQINVSEIPGRGGYRLRQELIRDLATGIPGVESGALLKIGLREQIERATLLPDGAVSRSFYNASGSYVLETSSGPISGRTSVQVPYAASRTPYTDVSAQTYAAERAMAELSRKIVEQLRIQAQNQE